MATANPQRADLYARLEEILGRPYADTLMTYLPEQPSATIATKDDIADLALRIDQLGERMERRFEQVDARFGQVDARFAHMERQFERVDHRFEQMENRFHIVRDDLRDQMKTYTLTVVGSMTALTAIYAGLLAVIA
jgi:tetrahydromethanopterin S-methyltransferase subunit G